jgi:hypothetical protein
MPPSGRQTLNKPCQHVCSCTHGRIAADVQSCDGRSHVRGEWLVGVVKRVVSRLPIELETMTRQPNFTHALSIGTARVGFSPVNQSGSYLSLPSGPIRVTLTRRKSPFALRSSLPGTVRQASSQLTLLTRLRRADEPKDRT